MVAHERWSFSIGHSQTGLLQGFAIERAKITRNWRANPFARAEALLSTDVKRQLGFQFAFVFL
jgi:hypothetical protein